MVTNVNDNGLKPVGGGSVVERTIKRIMDAIADGTYKIGQKLPNEYELIGELQISRNSLREAMRVLSTLGVVEIRRGDGTYICDQINPSVFDSMIYGLVFDASSSAELIEMRQSLDEVMLKLAVNKATEEDIINLENCIEDMKTSFANGDLANAASADYRFHMTMVDICRNKLLSRIIKGVYQFYRNSIYVNIQSEEEFAHAAEYHTDLLNVIKYKQTERIDEVVSNSLESWRNNIRRD